MSTILITGCSSGIGYALAKLACERGHIVVATMRALAGRNADSAARLRADCESSSGTLELVELDVTSDESVDRAIAHTLESIGPVDTLVHNAGIGSVGLLETFTTDQVRDVFEVNVFGPHRLSRALLPHMRERGSGLLVFVSSAISRIQFPYFAAYGPSKCAVEAMGECFHNELRSTGVEATVVQAGGFVTEFLSNVQVAADRERVESYGELGELASNSWTRASAQGMPEAGVLAAGLIELIESEAGTRPLRKVIDPMMGQALEAINEAIATIQGQVLAAMG